MWLYSRDFRTLTDEEKKSWDALKQQEIVILNGKPSNLLRKSLYTKYPSAVRHFLSLFPNNFLDPVALKNDQLSMKKKLTEFRVMVHSHKTSEREILNFIQNQTAYFIIGSILNYHLIIKLISYLLVEIQMVIILYL